MAPNSTTERLEVELEPKAKSSHEDIGATYLGVRFKTKVVWLNVLIFIALHAIGLHGAYLLLTFQFKWETLLLSCFLYLSSGILGITAGAHRLWTHRSYKAKWPLRMAMMIFNTVAVQNSIYEWTRDHRVHHKYSDTDADPHNSNRGFFFSHIGWLLMKKHPHVAQKGKGIDISDLHSDAFVMFQKKYYKVLALLLGYVLPTVIPVYFWNEDPWTAYAVAGAWKHLVVLHATWSVNSVAHIWGNKPYDKTLKPSENLLVALLAQGEGYHNYHHTFPFDYSTSEYRFGLNVTTFFIDTMARLNLVYDRKKVNKETIRNRRMRTGDLLHEE